MDQGFIGDGLPFVAIQGPIDAVACGFQFTCTLVKGQAFCFGLNHDFQLGLGDSFTRGNGSAAPYNVSLCLR